MNHKLLQFEISMNTTNLGNQLLTNIQTEIQLSTSHSHKCFQCLTVRKYRLISVTAYNSLYSRNCGKLLVYFHHRKLIFGFLYHLKTCKFKRSITAHYFNIKTFKVWKINKNYYHLHPLKNRSLLRTPQHTMVSWKFNEFVPFTKFPMGDISLELQTSSL